MITTVLMAGLGSYILWQTIWVRWVFPSFIFGLALFLFGILRMRMIWLYFQERVKKHGT
jgi:hypothetical protein